MNRDRIRLALAVILCGALAFGLANPASAFVHLARQATPTSPVVQAHWFPSELPLKSTVNPKNNDTKISELKKIIPFSSLSHSMCMKNMITRPALTVAMNSETTISIFPKSKVDCHTVSAVSNNRITKMISSIPTDAG